MARQQKQSRRLHPEAKHMHQRAAAKQRAQPTASQADMGNTVHRSVRHAAWPYLQLTNNYISICYTCIFTTHNN